jgi:hypothetical protein
VTQGVGGKTRASPAPSHLHRSAGVRLMAAAEGGWTEGHRREAQAVLLGLHRLAPWVERTGADVDQMQGRLLRTAGLTRLPQG